MSYDPTLYKGAAAYYLPGRPPYSRSLVQRLASEIGLDGSGRMLDVGCGPGVLTTAFAELFDEVIALDPDADMLAEGVRRANQMAADNIRWVMAVAEDIESLDLGGLRLVTFGQSFHWTDGNRVARMVYDSLDPEGTLAIITHAHDGRPQPKGPGYPPIPHDEIHAILERYLGSRRRAGQGFASWSNEPHEDVIIRAGFEAPHSLFCIGRGDIVQDIDCVLANYLSTSYAAPHLFKDRLRYFVADVRALLTACSPSGLFWDWPGDTQILLARKTKLQEQ